MKSLKYLIGAAVAVVGLTAVGMAHDSYYDDGYGRYGRRQEHRDYHADQKYEHWLFHQYPHTRWEHKRFHREQKLEHRDFHRYQRDRYDQNYYRDYYRDSYGPHRDYRYDDPYYRY